MTDIDTSTEAVQAMERKLPDMTDEEVFVFIAALAADRDEWIDVADDQMKLQKAARRAAFEEAAKICAEGLNWTPDSVAREAVNKCINAIRAKASEAPNG